MKFHKFLRYRERTQHLGCWEQEPILGCWEQEPNLGWWEKRGRNAGGRGGGKCECEAGGVLRKQEPHLGCGEISIKNNNAFFLSCFSNFGLILA